MWWDDKSTFMCSHKGQRSRICGKLFLSCALPLVVKGESIGTLTQLPRDFFKHMPEDAGLLAYKSQETATLGYSAFSRWLIRTKTDFRVHRDPPLDHSSVKYFKINPYAMEALLICNLKNFVKLPMVRTQSYFRGHH